MTINTNKINPNGLKYIAPQISPFKMDIIERVDPQEGQGIVVIRLNKQIPGTSSLELICP